MCAVVQSRESEGNILKYFIVTTIVILITVYDIIANTVLALI
jgi:hypothetical protein